MNTQNDDSRSAPDSAAVLGAAISLWKACHEKARRKPEVNLSECYQGGDQCMREVMRVATQFEEWACRHVAFEKLGDVWPYLLEDKFGRACIKVVGVGGLVEFECNDCLRVAMKLRLPLRPNGLLPVPILEEISNPTVGSAFQRFRIQTVRTLYEGGEVVPFTCDDDPFASEYSPPVYALYGVYASGVLEHIADRKTFMDAVNLAQCLVPGLSFEICLRS